MRPRAMLIAAATLSLAAATTTLGQSSPTSPFDQEFLRSFPEERPDASGPRLTFRLLNEIALPGPLPGGSPRLLGRRIAIPVAGSLAVTGWGTDAVPLLRPELASSLPGEPGATIWVESTDGKARYRALPEGWIVSEKRCARCKRGWRKNWKLRVSGSTLSSPVVGPRRLYFGAMDNRLYSVKRRNGHRVWVADAESRLSRPLVRWQLLGSLPGAASEEPAFELILAVPDDRAEIQAWSAEDGTKVATFALADDGGQLIGVPLVTPDGKIAVARQMYAPAEASLMVLQLVPIVDDPSAPEDSAIANGSAPAGGG